MSSATTIFSCNVTSPTDAYAGQPEWNTFSLTFKDPDTCGYVQHFTVHSINAFIRGLPEAIDAQTLPLIQLLPMATMASHGHHTVLECALTLTLNAISSSTESASIKHLCRPAASMG